MAKKDKKMQEEVAESARRIWLAGLGALRVAQEEGSKLFSNLVERGEQFEGRGREGFTQARENVNRAAEKARGTAGQAWQRFGEGFDKQVAETLGRIGVPSRDEIARLSKRIEDLTRAVDELRHRDKGAVPAAKPTGAPTARAAGAGRPVAKKSAAKKAAPKQAAPKQAAPKKGAKKPPAGPREVKTAADVTTTTQDVSTR